MEFDLLSNASFDAMFAATSINQQQQLDTISQQALSSGAQKYMDGDYSGAAKEFKRSLGLSPYGEYNVQSSDYLAKAYIQMGEDEKAIKAYKQSIKLNPLRDDIHTTLGNMYFSLNRNEEAHNEYEEAVRLYPSANNHFALGQSHLSLDNLSDAEATFAKVKRMEPGAVMGDYGLGQTYSKMGRYEKAVEHFQEAVNRDNKFYDGYAEIGYAYTDMGMIEEAEEIKDFLLEKDPNLAYTLSQYMYQENPPQFSTAYYDTVFGGFPAKTSLSTMDAYLETAGASKTYELKISFDKEMDRASVENLANWRIARASGSGPGEAYNFGLPIPETEVNIPALPINVYYDEEDWTATIKFNITQNSTADGTIDPTHVEFQFSGEDVFGKKIDPDADQYNAFSGIA